MLNLRNKLLLLLIMATGLSTFLVGGSLAWFSVRGHQQDAEARFAAARQVVAAALQRIELSAQSHAAVIAARDGVIASLSMISRYQNKVDYRPLIFNPEKERLARELSHDVHARQGDIGDRLIALYDRNADLVSFAVANEGETLSGYVTYRDSQPAVNMLEDATASGIGDIPAPLRAVYASDIAGSAGLRYLLREGTLFVQASAPIDRARHDGSVDNVGRVVVGGLLDDEFVASVNQEAGINLVLAAPDLPRLVVAHSHLDTAQLQVDAPHWHDGGDAPTLDTGTLLIKRFRLPLAESTQPALLIMAIDKAPLLEEMRHTRDVVLAVLALSILFVLPLGAYIGKRSITDPVRHLVMRVEAIRHGDYRSGPEDRRDDELGWLGRNISAMADTIRLREKDLRDNQESLNEAQRIAQLGNWDWNSTDGRLRCSDEVYRILDVPPEALAGEDYRFILPRVVASDRERLKALLTGAFNDGLGYETEYRLLGSDGKVQTINEKIRVYDAPSGNRQLFGTVQVVTELRKVENALRRSNRALKTLSACNQDLVHASCEQELLQSVCRDLVEVGEYRLAWVGFAEPDPEKRVRPVASSGKGADYLKTAHITWDDSPEGSGPTGMAIRTGQPQVMHDIHRDPRYAPWREAAEARGYASSIAFPLTDESGHAFGALNLYSSAPNAFDETEILLLEELAGDIAFGVTNLRIRQAHDEMARTQGRYLQRLQASMQNTVQVLSSTIEIRDPYTAGHQRRVAELAAAIARELGMEEERVHGIYLAGIIHDIGKINIPAEILSKPGRLSDIEFTLIKTHPVAGYEILKHVEFPWPIADMVHQHHERLDGSGYPQGLRAEAIMPEACILTVADVVEAMASDRPYRPGLGVDAALEEIERNRGRFYDPDAATACIRLFREKGFAFS